MSLSFTFLNLVTVFRTFPKTIQQLPMTLYALSGTVNSSQCILSRVSMPMVWYGIGLVEFNVPLDTV